MIMLLKQESESALVILGLLLFQIPPSIETQA